MYFWLPLGFIFLLHLTLQVNMDILWIKESKLFSNVPLSKKKIKTAKPCDVIGN